LFQKTPPPPPPPIKLPMLNRVNEERKKTIDKGEFQILI